MEVRSSSFQSHCGDGEQNADEDDVDCGGADCIPCILEFSFTSTSGNNLVDGNELYLFFSSIQGLVDSDDAVSFMITGAGSLSPYARGWCSDGNADWYAATYLSYFNSGFSGCSNAPSVDMYTMCAGDMSAWSQMGQRSSQSCYNGDWFGTFGAWGGTADTGLGIDPNNAGSCELQDYTWGCSDSANPWTVTVRVGRGSSLAEVCNANADFTTGTSYNGDSSCGWD